MTEKPGERVPGEITVFKVSVTYQTFRFKAQELSHGPLIEHDVRICNADEIPGNVSDYTRIFTTLAHGKRFTVGF